MQRELLRENTVMDLFLTSVTILAILQLPGATESVSSGSDNPNSRSSSMIMTREVTTMTLTTSAFSKPSSSNAAAVVVTIVVIILLVVTAIVVVVVVLILLRWKKSYQNVHEIQLNSMYSNNTSAINPVVVDDDIELDNKSPTMTNSTEVKDESKRSVGGHKKCEELSDVDKNVPTPNSAVEIPNKNDAGQVALVISPEYEDVDRPTKATSEKPTNNNAGQVALVSNQVISPEYEDVDMPTKTTSEKPKNNDAGQVALVNNQVISPEYEDVDIPIKTTTSEKSSKKVNVPQYEDMDDLIFTHSDKSSKDMSPTDNCKPYNRLSFDFGNTTSRRQTYDPSDNTYSHLDSTTVEEIRPRSDTVPGMYAAVHKPPKKPERRNTVSKIGEESDLPTVPEIPGKKSSDETSPADKLPPPKPSRRNTKSNNKEAESSLPPPIPEKTLALKNELKSMDSPSQSGEDMEQQDSTTSSDNTSENVASRSTKISVANNPLYGKEASRPSFENIYETVFQDFKQPEAFTEKKPLEVETSTLEEPLEVLKKNIKEVKELGAGQFGRVILAKTVKLSHADLKMGSSTDTKISVNVAVKILKASASETTRKKFEKEYRFMFKLNHPNVIRMLGICTEGQQPFIMMEYMEKGDLLEILKTYSTIVKGEAEPGDKEITEKKLIDICTQIATGMVYLASKNLVHRDLAARNCLVGENFTVKVADFGMSRSLYDSNYYAMKGNGLLPVRWMAYECFHGKFSTKTDVWAFGCTMWEVFDLAKQKLYPGMTEQEVVDNILLGSYCTVPYCPADCPGSVYEIMRECWIFEPTDRATFEEVHSKLSALNMS